MIEREQYAECLLRELQEHLRRYPQHTEQDIVKFVFQGMLGVGHLLAPFDQVVSYAAEEMAKVQPDSKEHLVERISPVWQRLNLRRARAEDISPLEIARMMFYKIESSFTRMDVYRFCCEHSEISSAPIVLRTEAEKVLEEQWLPSHSDIYKAAYHPAYRVIPIRAAGILGTEKRNN